MDKPQRDVLNGFDFMKSPQIKKAANFSNTTPVFLDAAIHISLKGEALSIDPACDDHLLLAMAVLGKFAIIKNIPTETVKEMVSSYIYYLTSVKGKLADIRTMTNISTCNVICSIIIGHRFDYDDKEFQNLIAHLNSTALDQKNVGLISYISWLKYLPRDLFVAKRITLNVHVVLSLLKKFIAVKRHNEVDGNDAENFIEAYLAERKKKVESGVSTYMDDDSLTKIINELFGPGTGPARTTIYRWGFQMPSHSYVQDKVYGEIKKHARPDKPSNVQDKTKLRTAVIADTQGLASTAPFSLLTCSADATLNTTSIPKESHVMPKLGSVLCDKTKGNDIVTLNPEKFLDANSQLLDREDQIPCITGQRVALGETKNKIELFMFFGNVFQRC